MSATNDTFHDAVAAAAKQLRARGYSGRIVFGHRGVLRTVCVHGEMSLCDEQRILSAIVEALRAAGFEADHQRLEVTSRGRLVPRAA